MSTVTSDISRLIYTIGVTSNEGEQALPVGMAHELIQIIVIPPNPTTTYKLYMQDGLDDMRIWKREDELVGNYNEILSPCLPIFGNYTFHIIDASEDGVYKVRLIYKGVHVN